MRWIYFLTGMVLLTAGCSGDRRPYFLQDAGVNGDDDAGFDDGDLQDADLQEDAEDRGIVEQLDAGSEESPRELDAGQVEYQDASVEDASEGLDGAPEDAGVGDGGSETRLAQELFKAGQCQRCEVSCENEGFEGHGCTYFNMNSGGYCMKKIGEEEECGPGLVKADSQCYPQNGRTCEEWLERYDVHL